MREDYGQLVPPFAHQSDAAPVLFHVDKFKHMAHQVSVVEEAGHGIRVTSVNIHSRLPTTLESDNDVTRLVKQQRNNERTRLVDENTNLLPAFSNIEFPSLLSFSQPSAEPSGQTKNALHVNSNRVYILLGIQVRDPSTNMHTSSEVWIQQNFTGAKTFIHSLRKRLTNLL